ncbi:MAG: bacillithiol biosynthesis cysteine-adding enzyme BshC [candidate division NC10 bacterium]|nr:bacillithiol biosynthesis cysteine-adding enzyme BshC [candidate division NC10 bacterium]
MMRLDLRQLPGTSSLIRDYVHAFPRLAPFYAGNPQAPDAYQEQADRCDARAYRRHELRDLLLAQNERWGVPHIVRQRIEELGHPRAVAVVTGQQTGLFGGPLFTLYKALTAVQLAARLQVELRRPVIPIFWMASEDHDVAEADHIQLLDRTGTPVTLRHAPWGSPSGFIPANLRLGPAIAETLERTWALLPATEFTPALRDVLGQVYAPERTLAEAFARWMVHLLGGCGLVLLDGADPGLKRLAAGILQRELDEAPRSSRAILEVSQSLRALGYPVQIEARPDGVNCFLLREGRRGLVKDGNGFRLRDSKQMIPAADLLRLAQDEPERFSPNVVLRPVVQDCLFPTLAYVAGPGELAYFAQLRPVYQAFDVRMPLVVPRASLTLVEPRIGELLERFRLGLPDLTLEPEQLSSRVLRAHLPPDLEATLAKARESVGEVFRGVGEAIAAVDPTLRATAGQTAGHVQGHLDQLERKAVQALKRRESEMRQQVQRVRGALMPGGKPQERVLPLLPFLARYGPALLETLRAAIDGPGWEHRLLTL